MKHLFFSLFLMATMVGHAQYYRSYQAKINYGESFSHGDIRIEFLKIISDSRCPKSVNCVWAGEAKVQVAIYKGRKKLGKKTLIFDASGVITDKKNLLFSDEEARIIGMALFPYPQSPDNIPAEAYCLEVKIN